MVTTTPDRPRALPPERLGSRSSPAPGLLVARECARALGSLLLAPPRALIHALLRRRRMAALQAELARPAPVDEPPEVPEEHLRRADGAALRVFVSCAEPSGELHAARFVEALRERCMAGGAPAPEFVGLGGARLAAVGVEIVGDPVARAAMGADVLRSLSFYLKLIQRTARSFRDGDIDLFVPVDSPALHVPLGRIARTYGLPVVHYVTPQYWGWAPWRVGGYRRAVDRALTILPFEPAWFRKHGVASAHVGHPQLDALAELDLPRGPRERSSGVAARLVLLPGSRASVVQRNLPWMLTAAARLRLARPELEVEIGCAKPALRAPIDQIRDSARASWARVAGGELHALLAGADLALSVSGTILIDLLERRLPAVVIYRLKGPLSSWLAPRTLTVPWFSSVNLLAGREVYPEFAFHGEGPLEEVFELLLALHEDPQRRRSVQEGLESAARALGPAGAARRAAGHALDLLGARREERALPA